MLTHSQSRREYETRINRVMDFVHRHLAEDLSMHRLAKVACFSPFHFHRIFSALTGETINAFVRRIRLEHAAWMLTYHEDTSITSVAMECGFSSSATFARAFQNHFGMSAGAWRKNRAVSNRRICKTESRKCKKDSNAGKGTGRRSRYNSSPSRSLSKEKKMKPNVVTFPSYKVAYMRYTGPYGKGVSDHWVKFWKWCRARDLTSPETISMGISLDDAEVTPPAKCRYDACIVVDENFTPPPGANIQEIPGGKYACFPFNGTTDDIQTFWPRAVKEWLVESGYVPDNRPFFELYHGDNDCEGDNAPFKCDVCIPVRPL